MIRLAEACDTLSVIKRLQSELSKFIEPDFGLLDQLMSLQVLTRPELADVRSERTVYRRTDALLDLLTTQDQCDKFLKALKKTGQQHVVNYITQNGGQKQCLSVTFAKGRAYIMCLRVCSVCYIITSYAHGFNKWLNCTETMQYVILPG